MKKLTCISDLYFEHHFWLNDLSVEKLGFVSLQSKLDEFTSKYSQEDTLKRLEYFQNKFIHHNEIIDNLKHDLNIYAINLSNYTETRVIAINDQIFKDHIEMREKVESQEHLFKDLKYEFVRFVTNVQ